METVLERPLGVATLDDMLALSGREMMEAMRDGHQPAPPISGLLDFELIEVGEGCVTFSGRTSPKLLNPVGVVHGGWLLTLIDTACACAVLTRLPPGQGNTSIETKGNFLRPVRADGGRVRCEAEVVGLGRQVSTAHARVFNADGRIVAHGTSSLLTVDMAAYSARRNAGH